METLLTSAATVVFFFPVHEKECPAMVDELSVRRPLVLWTGTELQSMAGVGHNYVRHSLGCFHLYSRINLARRDVLRLVFVTYRWKVGDILVLYMCTDSKK